MLSAIPIPLQQPVTTFCQLGCKLPGYQNSEMEILREQSPDCWAAVLMGCYPPLSGGLCAQLLLLPLLHLQKSDRHKAILLPFSTTSAITILSACPNCTEFDLEVSWLLLSHVIWLRRRGWSTLLFMRCPSHKHAHSLLRIFLLLIVSGYGVE